MDSILTSIKKMLGITAEYTHFDNDIIMHINSVFMILFQLGVGPQDKAFFIEGSNETWDEFTKDEMNVNSIKSYMYLRVRLLFDSSSLSSATMEAIKEQIKEFEWRLNVQVDP